MSDSLIHATFAEQFGQALVSSDFAAAHAMLTPTLAESMTAAMLEAQYREMVSYFESPASGVQVVNTLEEWPGKEPGDIGWAYAAIWGESGSEAVTVVVTARDGKPAIRSIEWGRP